MEKLLMEMKLDKPPEGKIIRPVRKNSFEKAAWSFKQVVCGIDEVGRGCLAGPLVTAAVILPPNKTHTLLKDSKILTEQQRLKSYAWICKHCWYAVGIVDHHCIDKHNIWRATLISMKKALMLALVKCPHKPASILIDAMPLQLMDTSYNTIPVYYFYKGERKSSSIAAASIVAKVTRDNIMQKFDSIFPDFFLGSHKGYSTKGHKTILKEKPPLIIHRRSFLTHIDTIGESEDEYNEQQTICGSD
jgi:ribonuclease HII